MMNIIKYINSIRCHFICWKYGIKNYTINKDGSIDVDGIVILSKRGLTKLPLKFGKVNYGFYCHNNNLITLEGSPTKVGGNFYCDHNKLKTLKGGPIEVGNYFDCSNNQLTNLKGSPMIVGGSFYCDNNQLDDLVGSPKIGRNFYYRNNIVK